MGHLQPATAASQPQQANPGQQAQQPPPLMPAHLQHQHQQQQQGVMLMGRNAAAVARGAPQAKVMIMMKMNSTMMLRKGPYQPAARLVLVPVLLRLSLAILALAQQQQQQRHPRQLWVTQRVRLLLQQSLHSGGCRYGP
jgi:hypothetical protein